MKRLSPMVRQIIGWMLIGIGVLGIVIPIFPQLPFLAAGALMLAPFVPIFRRFSNWLHERHPKLLAPLQRFHIFRHEHPVAHAPSAPPAGTPAAGAPREIDLAKEKAPSHPDAN